MGDLQRVWYADRGRLLLRTPGPVPLWDLQVFKCCDQSLLNLCCFLIFEFRTSLGTSVFAKNKCKSQMGQDQVSGGVSVLCWLAAPVAMFYRNLQNVVLRSKSVIKSSSVISLQIGVMSDQLRVSLYMVMS